MQVVNQHNGQDWVVYLGDAVQVLKGVPESSVDFCLHSPPFMGLYIYTDSENDLGNCRDMEEFCRHYQYVIREMLRVTVPGRICAIHCKDLPKYANVWGTTGLIDFPGACIQEFEAAGWVFHSRVTIWKCPVLERERTNNNGLLHKTVKRDSSQLRQGMADYLICFRKPPLAGDGLLSQKPASRPNGFARYIGEMQDLSNQRHPSKFSRKSRDGDNFDQSVAIWRRYAEPVWWDIDQTDVLNFKLAKSEKDARHICLARGSLVLTRDGHKPIEDVSCGDMVLTHLGRWRPVIAKVCNGVHPVIRTTAQGVADLRTTPDHKLWVRRNDGQGGKRWLPGLGEPEPADPCQHRHNAKTATPEWMPASKVKSHYVNLPLPPIEGSPYTAEEWWLVGRWLGDGHVDTRGGLHITCAFEETEELVKALGRRAGFVATTQTANQVRISDNDGSLRRLVSRFGKGADGKHLPAEALSLDLDKSTALLAGYMSADGHYVEKYRRWTASSVSRPLLLGMAMVAQRVKGVVASVYAGRPPGECVIEGRRMKTLQDWIFSIPPKNMSGIMLSDGAWKKVRSVKPAGESEVWDIQVADDSSFVAEGCVVHNCPLQLGVIERAVEIWSLPGEVVLSPFAGVCSEGVGALRQGRKFVGIELKKEYVEWGVKFLQEEETKQKRRTLFDGLPDVVLLAGGQPVVGSNGDARCYGAARDEEYSVHEVDGEMVYKDKSGKVAHVTVPGSEDMEVTRD